jgi:pectinesterase
MQPNATVAKDGSGQYKTVTDGINSYPTNYQGRYIIYVKAGIYNEYITIDERKHNILLYGDDLPKPLSPEARTRSKGSQCRKLPRSVS